MRGPLSWKASAHSGRGPDRGRDVATLALGRRARAGVARPLRACKDGQPAVRESLFLLHPMARLLTWLFRCVYAGAARMRPLCFAFPGLPRTPSTAQDMPPRRLRSHRRVVSVDAQYSKMRPKCKAALRNFARTALVDGLATTEVSMKRQQRRCARVGRRERAGLVICRAQFRRHNASLAAASARATVDARVTVMACCARRWARGR